MVGPYIPIWNRKPSREEARKVVSWSKADRLPHIRIQLKDSKCVQKSIRNVLVPSKDLALIDPGKFFKSSLNSKLGCVVRMVVDSILPHAERGTNDHQKDAPPFTVI